MGEGGVQSSRLLHGSQSVHWARGWVRWSGRGYSVPGARPAFQQPPPVAPSSRLSRPQAYEPGHRQPATARRQCSPRPARRYRELAADLVSPTESLRGGLVFVAIFPEVAASFLM